MSRLAEKGNFMVYMLCADGLEECEALITLDMLRRADIDVKTVSLSEKKIKGAHGIDFDAVLILIKSLLDIIYSRQKRQILLPL